MTAAASDATDELCRLALEARERAHAPYSNYRVGCAVRAADGRVFVGCNVENASYGLTICAERTAVVSAVAAGAREFVEAAIATETSPPGFSCGVCRQTFAEFAGDEMKIVSVNPRGERQQATLGALLPGAFRRGHLEQGR